ncbi:MAG: lipid A deacylase LpxR family protein [Cytophagales bacterium]|nr:lipid A deacylase LpxR family protein [Cytophagales bacterium]
MRLIFLPLIFLIAIPLKSQDGRYLDREFQLELDNDAYTLDLVLDQYYSQGIYARYRVVDTTKSIKKIRSISLNHRIFTPSNIGYTDVAMFDRPYAGNFSVTGTITEFTSKNVLEYSLELGAMGGPSLAGPIQTEWHSWFGFGEPMGWDYQINDAPIINGYFKYANMLLQAGNLQILSESNVAAGTTFSYARQEVMIRLGKFKALDESISYGANLGGKKKKSDITQETIVFIAFGPEYVAHNSTIEGNFIGKSSVHTEERIPWVSQMRIGALFAWSSFDLSIQYYRRSAENEGATFHEWVGVKLSQRF